MLSALRDFAEGLSRGFNLFLTERREVATSGLPQVHASKRKSF